MSGSTFAARLGRRGAVALGVVLLAFATRAPANMVTKAVLEVDLKNPGNSVSGLNFYIQPSKTTQAIIDAITVDDPKVMNRYNPDTNTPNGPVEITSDPIASFVVLSPIRVYRPTERVTFKMTVPMVNSVRVSGLINNNGRIDSEPPKWFNNNTPITEITPGPILPGFKIVTDAQYTIYSNPDTPFGFQNLQFFPNLTESQFDALDLDSFVDAPFDPSLPSMSFLTDQAVFSGLPDPDPGNYFVAVGQILDTSGQVVGAFAHAVQVVPEPSSLLLTTTGLAGLLGIVGRRRLARDRT
jgi:hypothetical protein